MSKPTSREEFKDYVLRRLGAPVVRINVADEQVEDRIDDALEMFWDFHFDGSERVYISHQVSEQDKANGCLELDDKYIGVVRVFEIGSMLGSQGLFSLAYQFAQSDFMSSALTGSMVPYWMAMTHIELVQQVLSGKPMIRFNRKRGKLHIDIDWNKINIGDYVVVEAFEKVDPETHLMVWADRWLLRYATQMVKRQWGENLSKYSGMRMADGTMLNGSRIWEQAQAELDKLEEEMSTNLATPATDLWG